MLEFAWFRCRWEEQRDCRASNRVGSDYNSWINTLRSDFTRDLRRRNRVEAEAEKRHKPSVSKGTMGVVMVNSDKLTRTKDEWDCRIDPGTRGKDLVVQVRGRGAGRRNWVERTRGSDRRYYVRLGKGE
ncbi:uncharacterized protein LOC123501630 [Portunus trituberculatus]|uniref:uncharacterized protein LOC123501630 n=1 Tax=Portunus trituberculatus TaxID=210409 RepID=UPI001E1CECE4|nr:uncharacterized protein LOC123501630 [Portunus trituberculatus]